MSAQYPDDLFYTKDHEWARIEDRDGTKVATIGVTRFAVEQLGDVTQVDLPKEGEIGQAGRGVRLGRIGEGRLGSVRAAHRQGRQGELAARRIRPSTSTRIRTTRAG